VSRAHVLGGEASIQTAKRLHVELAAKQLVVPSEDDSSSMAKTLKEAQTQQQQAHQGAGTPHHTRRPQKKA